MGTNVVCLALWPCTDGGEIQCPAIFITCSKTEHVGRRIQQMGAQIWRVTFLLFRYI